MAANIKPYIPVKKYLTCLVVLSIFIACMSNKNYILPNGLTTAQKKDFVIQFNQGKTLYDLNCASCHNKIINKKIVEPDFTVEQFEIYKIRIKNEPHVISLGPQQITPTEMNKILFFFMNKKKNKSNPTSTYKHID